MSLNKSPNKKNQQGLVLLVLVVVIALAFVSYSVSNLSITNVKVEQVKSTQQALKKAKQALLNYAVLNVRDEPGYFGFLPCPDTGAGAIPEGGSHGTCGSKKVNSIGLFPWASLETGRLSSYAGDCFWYAISGEYKAVPLSNRTEMLNEDTNGAFKVYDDNGIIRNGVSPEERVVAIVFNPNGVLGGQDRNNDPTSKCGLDYTSDEYLEGDGTYSNAELSTVVLGIDDFIDSGPGSDELAVPFNDQLVVITQSELWNAVKKRKDLVENQNSSIRRLTEALALCIAEYGNNSGNKKLPRPAAVDFLGEDYRINDNYDDAIATINLGRYPYLVDNSDAELTSAFAPNEAEPVLFNKGYCDSLPISMAAGGGAISFKISDNTEDYIMWKNWKDHFFYAVSEYYEPSSTTAASLPNCDGTNCIKVGGVEYAGVVIYSGSRIGSQVRNEPIAGDVDTKNNVNNYLELFSLSDTGTADHTPTGNDLAFCITDAVPFTVMSCN